MGKSEEHYSDFLMPMQQLVLDFTLDPAFFLLLQCGIESRNLT